MCIAFSLRRSDSHQFEYMLKVYHTHIIHYFDIVHMLCPLVVFVIDFTHCDQCHQWRNSCVDVEDKKRSNILRHLILLYFRKINNTSVRFKYSYDIRTSYITNSYFTNLMCATDNTSNKNTKINSIYALFLYTTSAYKMFMNRPYSPGDHSTFLRLSPNHPKKKAKLSHT